MSTFHRPNTWNGSNNKYKAPAGNTEMIAMDKTGRDADGLNQTEDTGLFYDGSNVPIARTQTELTSTPVNENLRNYGCDGAGVLGYDPKLSVLEGADVSVAMNNNCGDKKEILIDAVSGEVVYDEVTGQVLYDEDE